MIEDLMAHLCGVDWDDVQDDVYDMFFEKFDIDVDQFSELVSKLLPLIEKNVSPLSGKTYKGFADRAVGVYLIKIEEQKA